MRYLFLVGAAMVLGGGLIAVGGCYQSNFEVRPGQEFALNLIWHEMYGRTDDPPQVEWMYTDALSAGQQGMTFAGWKIQLACGDNCDHPVENSTMAHELMHERTFRRTGDVDVFHYRGDWTMAQDADTALRVAIEGR